jgi:hypothetical protein
MLRTTVIALLASVMMLVAEHSAVAQPQPASADDTARFLAGMPPSSGSPLTALTQDPAWQQHARRFDSVFGNLDKNQFSKIRAWSSAKLTSPSPVLFYMFSGPDFLYADAFFPSASTYVMAGLEPTGPIPDVQRLPRGAVGEALRHIESSLSTILTISFFKTKDMRMTLGANRLSGTLPLLYVFLARTGKTIQDVTLIKLDDQGMPQPLNAPASPAMRNPALGVKIVFSGDDGTARTLYYFGTNIANDGFKSSGFEKFVARLGVGDGFVKSASYLMHGPGFSAVRSFLLRQTNAILQDDTGIPVAYFAADKWRLQPFGRYTGPIQMFAHNYQPRLTQLFQSGRAEPLNFGLGYQWRVLGSNLLLATRIEPLDPQAVAQQATDPAQGGLASRDESAAEQPVAAPKKTTSKQNGRSQKSRTAAPRPQPFFIPFFFGQR